MKSFMVALAISGLLIGCDNNPPTYPVSGKVVFPSGSPVRMGTIETKSRDLGVNARGAISADGTFSLSTFQPGDGAVAGMHDCVVVQLVIGEELAKPGSSFGVVDPKHNSYKTSGLTIDVKPEGLNEFKLQVSALRGREPTEKEHKH